MIGLLFAADPAEELVQKVHDAHAPTHGRSPWSAAAAPVSSAAAAPAHLPAGLITPASALERVSPGLRSPPAVLNGLVVDRPQTANSHLKEGGEEGVYPHALG